MRFVHISDLHLGKRVNEFSMIEDQRDILEKIIQIIDHEKPDGILIAGDVYDRSVPSEEAIKLWDDFLIQISERKHQVYAISGNHDSAVRFADHSSLVDHTGIHLSPVYRGKAAHYELEDEYGKVNIYMLPFIKPAMVRAIFPDEEIEDYTDACRVAVMHMQVDPAARNILVAHQFVVGASRCESEEVTVGGLDQVDGSVFDDFDYVALGHLHGPQQAGRETMRYSGTPLKYSFSEKDHHKSVTVIELGEKGDLQLRTIELQPLHDLRQIRGTFQELTDPQNYEGTAVEDYIHAVLTDEEDVFDAMAELRKTYPNLMKLTYDNKRTRENRKLDDVADLERKTPLQLFEEFYETQNNQPMNEEQRDYMKELIEQVWEGA